MSSLSPLTLNAPWLTDGIADISAETIARAVYLFPRDKPALSEKDVWEYATQTIKWTQFFRIRTSSFAAQSLHETDFLRFTGDVSPSQNNFHGLGATGGINGNGFKTIEDGIIAACIHHYAYIYGDSMPALAHPYKRLDVRIKDVLDAGYGKTVQVIGDYTNGKWAYSKQYPKGTLLNGYAHSIRDISNRLLEMESDNMLSIAINAGHNNKAGGNAVEMKQTARITNEIIKLLKKDGHSVICAQPNDGMGMYAGDYNEWAQEVTRRVQDGLHLDLFLSVHTEGGVPNGGVMAVYPDATEGDAHDLDVDVRDKLAPMVCRRLREYLGFSYRNGTPAFSERKTNAQRLGEFRYTYAIANHVTRILVEYGNRDNAQDALIMARNDYAQACAKATVEGIYEFFGITNKGVKNTTQLFPETNKTVGHGFLDFFNAYGGVPIFGYPVSEEYRNHNNIIVQDFERARFEHQPNIANNPYGVVLGRVNSELLEAEAALNIFEFNEKLLALKDHAQAILDIVTVN